MTETTAATTGEKAFGLPISVGLAAAVADRVTKAVVESQLQLYDHVAVIGDYVRLVLWHNEGAAFGIRLGGQWVHVVLSLLAMALVAYMAWHTPKRDRLGLSGFGLIMGGAVGNLWDRLVAGRVTDFIDVGIGDYRWPTFNVADSCVVAGIGLLIISYMLTSGETDSDDGVEVPSAGRDGEPEARRRADVA